MNSLNSEDFELDYNSYEMIDFIDKFQIDLNFADTFLFYSA